MVDDSSLVVDVEQLLAAAKSKEDIWVALIGQSVEHISLGPGRILNVDRSRKGSVYLKVCFESVNKTSEFSAESLCRFFLPRIAIDGPETSADLPPGLVVSMAEHQRAHRMRVAAREREVQQQRVREERERTVRQELAQLNKKLHAKGASALFPSSRLVGILQSIERRDLLSDDELRYLVQLEESGPLACYHQLVFEKTGEPWFAIKACGFWRDADQPKLAVRLATQVTRLGYESPMSYTKMAAALTTLGAAQTDLGNREVGRECARRALKLRVTFHPHNLLGRIYFEEGDGERGLYHFNTAVKLSSRTTFRHMRKALSAARLENRAKVASYLLTTDPEQYRWAEEFV